MPKFAANLTMLYNEHGFLDRFAAAAAAGFRGVEFLFPYAFPAEQIAERLTKHRLALVLHNLPAGNWEAGERGIACHPNRVGEFQDSVGKAIDYAKAARRAAAELPCRHRAAGRDSARRRARRSSRISRSPRENSRPRALRLLIEPINTFDIPGFFLSGTRQAIDIIDETGSANVFLQYDVYHMQRMEGELAHTIKSNLARIRHLQIADNPGRHEPGTGEINYPFLFRCLDDLGYDGWIGCEYKPATSTAAGLSWLAAYR